MLQSEIKSSFVELGNFLRQFSLEKNTKETSVPQNDLSYDDFISLVELSQSHNGWFTQEQVYLSIQSWGNALSEANLNQWLSLYDFSKIAPKKKQNITCKKIIMKSKFINQHWFTYISRKRL